MKEIPLTQGLVAWVDDDDFDRLPPGKWHASAGYACKRVNGRMIRLHRLVMGVLDDPSVQIDHIYGERTDCRKGNLRKCTNQQNSSNRKCRGKGKHKGVFWHDDAKSWAAQICVNYKSIYLGCFDDYDEAARHYNLRAAQEFGEFARLNDVYPLFPEGGVPKLRTLRKHNTSGFRGVHKDKKKWVAKVKKDGVQKAVFGFPCPQEAARAYDILAKEAFGEKAILNFPNQPLP